MPVLLFFGLWWYIAKRAAEGGGLGGGLMAIGKSKAKIYVEADTGVNFSDVAGVDEAKDELREISRHPLIAIGAHGLWHRHFPLLDAAEARFELIESRRLLESMIGMNIDLMAWPYGECNLEMEALSKQCGYRAAWSVWKGTNTAHSLWRVPLARHDNMVRFIAKVSGAYFPTKFVEQKWERLRNGA